MNVTLRSLWTGSRIELNAGRLRHFLFWSLWCVLLPACSSTEKECFALHCIKPTPRQIMTRTIHQKCVTARAEAVSKTSVLYVAHEGKMYRCM